MISVIIPVYNRIEALKRALASIASQTYKEVEVIVVDDGSEEKFKINAPIKLIRQDNKGAPTARNRGLMEAKGEYVIFWDADVIGEPQMLEKLKKILDENQEASFAYSNFKIEDLRLKIIKKIPAKKSNVKDLKQNNYIHSTSLIRRKDVIRWDESIKRFQDWDLWLTMAEQGKTGVWVDEYLFTVLSGGTISKWLPRFAYKAPFKWLPGIKKQVNEYMSAKKIVVDKHHLTSVG